MFLLPRPTRKNRPDPTYFIAKTEIIFFLFCAIKLRTKIQENASFCVWIWLNVIPFSVFKWKCFIVCTINLAHIVYFGIRLNCYFITMFWSDQLKKINLPIYPYYYDLGRGRENKKYFKLGLNENHYYNKTTVCSVIHTSSNTNSYLVSKQK